MWVDANAKAGVGGGDDGVGGGASGGTMAPPPMLTRTASAPESPTGAWPTPATAGGGMMAGIPPAAGPNGAAGAPPARAASSGNMYSMRAGGAARRPRYASPFAVTDGGAGGATKVQALLPTGTFAGVAAAGAAGGPPPTFFVPGPAATKNEDRNGHANGDNGEAEANSEATLATAPEEAVAPTTPLPERPAAVETEPAAAYSAEAEPSTPLDAKQRPKAEPATEQELAQIQQMAELVAATTPNKAAIAARTEEPAPAAAIEQGVPMAADAQAAAGEPGESGEQADMVTQRAAALEGGQQSEQGEQAQQQTSGWAEYHTDEGHTYFFNAETGESSWYPPEGFVSQQQTYDNAAYEAEKQSHQQQQEGQGAALQQHEGAQEGTQSQLFENALYEATDAAAAAPEVASEAAPDVALGVAVAPEAGAAVAVKTEMPLEMSHNSVLTAPEAVAPEAAAPEASAAEAFVAEASAAEASAPFAVAADAIAEEAASRPAQVAQSEPPMEARADADSGEAAPSEVALSSFDEPLAAAGLSVEVPADVAVEEEGSAERPQRLSFSSHTRMDSKTEAAMDFFESLSPASQALQQQQQLTGVPAGGPQWPADGEQGVAPLAPITAAPEAPSALTEAMPAGGAIDFLQPSATAADAATAPFAAAPFAAVPSAEPHPSSAGGAPAAQASEAAVEAAAAAAAVEPPLHAQDGAGDAALERAGDPQIDGMVEQDGGEVSAEASVAVEGAPEAAAAPAVAVSDPNVDTGARRRLELEEPAAASVPAVSVTPPAALAGAVGAAEARALAAEERAAALEAQVAALQLECETHLKRCAAAARERDAARGECDASAAAAAAAGRAEARAEAEEEMDDLIVCLGQEEEKVRRLVDRLEALGEDPWELIADVETVAPPAAAEAAEGEVALEEAAPADSETPLRQAQALDQFAGIPSPPAPLPLPQGFGGV